MLNSTSLPPNFKKGAHFQTIEDKIQFSPLKKIKLYFSFNRYSFLLLFCALLPALVIILLKPQWWWLWGIFALVGIWLLRWAWLIHAQTFKKFHILKKNIYRQNQTEKSSIGKYCSDPCYRVVANEILANQGLGFRQRKKIIRKMKKTAAEENKYSVVVDFKNQIVYKSDGTKTEKYDLKQGK
ncbi:MAG: MerC domain-containing protein [Myxococcota bacterium]